jgi:hypothetical protein
MVGKTWDFHVDVALEVDRTEYLEMISGRWPMRRAAWTR